jgi:hypothetical protein
VYTGVSPTLIHSPLHVERGGRERDLHRVGFDEQLKRDLLQWSKETYYSGQKRPTTVVKRYLHRVGFDEQPGPVETVLKES